MSTDFTVEVAQNEYLAEGGEDVNAVVTVTSPDSGLATLGEVFVLGDFHGEVSALRRVSPRVRMPCAGTGPGPR